MPWGFFGASGTGNLKEEEYEKILKENLKQSAAKLGPSRCFVYRHNKDAKHTSKLVKKKLLPDTEPRLKCY